MKNQVKQGLYFIWKQGMDTMKRVYLNWKLKDERNCHWLHSREKTVEPND